MLITKRPLMLAATLVPLIATAMPAPSAVATSISLPPQGGSVSSNSYPEHGNITDDPNVTHMVDNELNPTHAHTIQCTPLPFSE